MITLQRQETVLVYQVAMDLLVQNTQHPFIAILLLASELEEQDNAISPQELKKHLFINFPERACLNLLNRMAKAGYLYLIENEDFIINQFRLTQKGQDSVAQKSIWEGQKGTYNVYMTQSPLVPQQVVAVKQVENREVQDDRHANLIASNGMRHLEDKTIQIKSIDQANNSYISKYYYIECIDDKCFRLEDETWTLTCVATESSAVELRLQSERNQYERVLNLDYDDLRHRMLRHQFNFDYDEPCVLTSYEANQLDFVRSVSIRGFKLSGELFEPTPLSNVQHRPKTRMDAENWYQQRLKNAISKYYTDETFKIESERCKELFKPYFNLPLFSRHDLVRNLNGDKNDFYLKAKLETIDFLNY